MADDPDYREAGRKAHELQVAHGAGAYRYAVRLADEALADGQEAEHRFWKAVAATLRPR